MEAHRDDINDAIISVSNTNRQRPSRNEIIFTQQKGTQILIMTNEQEDMASLEEGGESPTKKIPADQNNDQAATSRASSISMKKLEVNLVKKSSFAKQNSNEEAKVQKTSNVSQSSLDLRMNAHIASNQIHPSHQRFSQESLFLESKGNQQAALKEDEEDSSQPLNLQKIEDLINENNNYMMLESTSQRNQIVPHGNSSQISMIKGNPTFTISQIFDLSNQDNQHSHRQPHPTKKLSHYSINKKYISQKFNKVRSPASNNNLLGTFKSSNFGSVQNLNSKNDGVLSPQNNNNFFNSGWNNQRSNQASTAVQFEVQPSVQNSQSQPSKGHLLFTPININNISKVSDDTPSDEDFSFPVSIPQTQRAFQNKSNPQSQQQQQEQQSIDNGKGFKPIITFDQYESSSKSELSNIVYNNLKQAQPFSTIILPDKHIVLPCIYMKHPMDIVGRPGTILEIINGNIVTDFRDFLRENPQYQQQNLRSTLSEVTLIFRLDPQKIDERLTEISSKSFYEEVSYSEKGMIYYKKVGNKIIVPLLVIENQSSFEVRDCYLRSMIKELIQLAGSDLHQKNPIIEVEESCFYVKGSEDSIDAQQQVWKQRPNTATALVKSCIFYNFFHQCKIGIDGTMTIERCHLSESRSSSIYAINPKAIKIVNSSFTNPFSQAIFIEWLKHSQSHEKCRTIVIEENDIKGSFEEGIIIKSQSEFSIHNLKINIIGNKISYSKTQGIAIADLAVSGLQICNNDVSNCKHHCIMISQVHQKSNKFKFVMRQNQVTYSETGYGCFIFDSGFLIEKCFFDFSKSGGVYISCYERPESPLQQEVQEFLVKYPLANIIDDCNFSKNSTNGCVIKDFWKGPVQISGSKLTENLESGLIVEAEHFPISLAKYVEMRNPVSQSSSLNRIQPTTSESTLSKNSILRYLNAGCVYVSKCDIGENRNDGIKMSNVQMVVSNSFFFNNLKYAIYVPNSEQSMLLKMKYQDHKKFVKGLVGGEWGHVKIRSNGAACCSSTKSKAMDKTNQLQPRDINSKCKFLGF